MIIIWDGLKSLFAAAIAVFLCGGTGALAVLALRGLAVPDWAVVPGWIAVAGLGLVGLILGLAFLRKSWRGVSPSRDRRR